MVQHPGGAGAGLCLPPAREPLSAGSQADDLACAAASARALPSHPW